ncbi:MAG TPA: 3'-5' exonuclease [Candidatus Vogelbacteria bacterium]|nr:3'-5' exonuclease [Candidatus Vogelbacteria bacterium]
MKKTSLAFIDTETTGLDCQKNEIIELAVILTRLNLNNSQWELETTEEKDWKIKPSRLETADPRALKINGYNEAEWLFAPDLKSVMEDFVRQISGYVIVAHNLIFDWGFLSEAFRLAEVKDNSSHIKLDTLSIAYTKLFNQNINSLSLKALAEYYEIKNEKAHTALADARVTKSIFCRLMNLNEIK